MKSYLSPIRLGRLSLVALSILTAFLPAVINARGMDHKTPENKYSDEIVFSSPLFSAELTPKLPTALHSADEPDDIQTASADNTPEIISSPEKTNHTSGSEAETPARMVTGEEATTQRIFGLRGGYFHPFLSLRGEWTDNLYNLNFDETENFQTTVTSGLWVSLPRTEKIPLKFNTRNSAVGGLRFSLPQDDSFERFRVYAGGLFDYKNNSADSELNYIAWRAEGMYQQNLPAGISFRFVDQFARDQDRIDIGSFSREDFRVDNENIFVASSPSGTRSYYSNLADFSIHSEMSHRFSTRFSYANFYLDYDGAENQWLDRVDNRFSASAIYRHSPKTNIFVEYDYTYITYNSDTYKDSDNEVIYLGMNWNGSSKSSLQAKAGYQQKQYSSSIQDDTGTYSPSRQNNTGTFTTKIQFRYHITDKTNMSLSVYKALEETDSLNNQGRNTTAGSLDYTQQFTYKIHGSLNLSYEKSSYDEFTSIELNDRISGREDKRFTVRPSLRYIFRDWLMGEIAYTFENCDSSDNLYDYTSNSVLLSLNIAF